MKIIKLQSENIKRLTAVEIEPSGNVIKISGKNAQGKSSIMDSIWWALGGKDAIQGQPIREGEEKARIKLDLGDLVVERKFTASGTVVTVKNKEGAQFSSPQKMLDELVGRLTFDPLEFMRMDHKKQAETLKDLCDLDFAELDRDRQKAFAERTIVNRDYKEKQAHADSISVPEDTPDTEVDVADLSQKITAAMQENRDLDDRWADLRSVEERIEKGKQHIQELKEKLSKAEELLRDLEQDHRVIETACHGSEYIDVQSLQDQMNQASEINKAVARRRERDHAQVEANALKEHSEELTQQLTMIDSIKATKIKEARMPVDGLGFNDDGIVTFNGIPISQASSAEQLKISIAMAMSLNPKLRVLRITDGSLLDSDSWEIVEAMAKEGDYQIWAEVVDETGEVGIVIEDGHVVAVNEAS